MRNLNLRDLKLRVVLPLGVVLAAQRHVAHQVGGRESSLLWVEGNGVVRILEIKNQERKHSPASGSQ